MNQFVSQNTGRVTLRQSQFFAPSWAQIFGEITFPSVPKKLVILTFQICDKYIVCRLSYSLPAF